MTNKTNTLKILSMIVAVTLVATTPVMTNAQITPGEDGPITTPARTGSTTLSDDEISKKVDEIGFAMLQLKIQNQHLAQFSTNELIQDMINDNEEEIEKLFAQMMEIWPPLVVVEIPADVEARMNTVLPKLAESGLPVLGMGIDHLTGTLSVKVDVERTTPDTEQKIREIAGDVPLSITFVADDAVFQSASCDRTTGYCDPLVGGSLGEDRHWGLECTISIAAVRNTGNGTENGIVIPDHCNKETTQYYQPDNARSSYLVGSETKDGGWFCDCDFVKSNSRAIDATKLIVNGSDFTLSGKSDLRVGDYVFMYGAKSGYDVGRIVSINQWQTFDNRWFWDLYAIEDINFTDGDSGAPIVGTSNDHYAGMNIGTFDGHNYGHDWSILKSRLGLQ